MKDEKNWATPDCAEWQVWEGLEIEGDLYRGVKTLFVRGNFDPNRVPADEELLDRYERIWFTGDRRIEWRVIEWCVSRGKNVAVEVYFNEYGFVPTVVREFADIYLVLPHDLKPTDHVKIGTRYFEKVVSLQNITPQHEVDAGMYRADRVIKL